MTMAGLLAMAMVKKNVQHIHLYTQSIIKYKTIKGDLFIITNQKINIQGKLPRVKLPRGKNTQFFSLFMLFWCNCALVVIHAIFGKMCLENVENYLFFDIKHVWFLLCKPISSIINKDKHTGQSCIYYRIILFSFNISSQFFELCAGTQTGCSATSGSPGSSNDGRDNRTVHFPGT